MSFNSFSQQYIMSNNTVFCNSFEATQGWVNEEIIFLGKLFL